MKLKKLILTGFKSFADRTEMEFDDGISAVVGPNGCGKSNVVDAVKWVLGEQSAKSLRGSEMLDVIFNGSSARRAASCAEVTLIFDNSDGTLQLVNAEASSSQVVSITRRLFRDGTSEYLINKLPSRLRDIREMFMDTGVGVDAYSLIEQGRVEAFLQASQDERRAIFDEAAGISKYKARKKEASRKLERVEQNLLRINDVLQEVDKRLRSIKYQAGKARSYQQYSEQLKELRTLHFLAQYHTLSRQRTELQKRLDEGSDALSAVAVRIDQLESARSAAEVELADLERVGREIDGRLASIGASISASEQRAEMMAARVKELADSILRAASRCEEMEAKIATFDETLSLRQGELEGLGVQAAQLSQRYEAVRQQQTAGELSITKLSSSLEDEKSGTIDLLRRTAQLHNEMQASRIRRENFHNQQTRLTGRAQEIANSVGGMLGERSGVEARLAEVRELIAASQARLEETRQSTREVGDAEHELRGNLSAVREKRSGLLSRRDALREMQARHEGVSGGVRSVLKAARDGKLSVVRGMLGDYIQTDTQHAPLVEAALAGADQQLVVERSSDLGDGSELAKVVGEAGTVEVLCLDRLETLTLNADVVQDSRIVGRVIDFVQSDALVAPAVWRLLGRTLVVSTLADAVALSATMSRGWRFVTQAGQVVEADGRVRIGAANRGAGVITRRSELTELGEQLSTLEQTVAQLEGALVNKKSQREHLEELTHSLRTAIYESNTQRVEAQSRLGQLNDQVEKLRREEPLVAKEIERLSAQIDESVKVEREAGEKATGLEDLSKQRQEAIARLTEEMTQARAAQAELSRQMTEARVAMAQAEEKKRSLSEALASLRRQREQLDKDLSASRAQIDLDRQRSADAQAAIVSAKEEVERLYQQQETLSAQAQETEQSRRGLCERLDQIRQQVTQHRKVQEESAGKVNAVRVQVSESDVRIEGLIGRAGEEGMTLLEAYANYQHDEGRDWDAVAAEIADLKGKIERLGNVNLDAIAEQEDLEKRQEFLNTQLADIKASQQQLDELIKRINKESRDMFIQTFEAVRVNFQELFRKLFGGGRADILLVNPDDVLESGIEIVARPPGKETRSLSLLSGGEKTMTALAMLFSIFRSRPSPFCILDEVDAALDEANNRRFNALVQEFVETSQFIIITHSKRSMSIANVLYGITMQEPGVSKRVAVKFEESGKKPELTTA